MKLLDLIKNIAYIDSKGDLEIEITSLTQDATKQNIGALLFCYKGVKFDTHDYASTFASLGFCALIVEKFVDSPLPQILVKNTRNIMPKVCEVFFGKPSKKLKFIGVTGTNGKTTTTNLIYHFLTFSGKKCALIGTNGTKYLDTFLPSRLTTPDTVDLFYMLDTFVKSGVEYVVMEVSAHALDLKKLKGIHFDVAIFSNLTQDHLDYFGNMGNYAKCKLKFFQKSYSKYAIINTDDKYGRLFSKLLTIPFTTYGIKDVADNFAIDINYSLSGTSFVANIYDNVFDLKVPLLCEFNVYNILSSMLCAKYLGIENDVLYKAVLCAPKVDGRMNVYPLKNSSIAVIDYAHTPDGLENVLKGLFLLPRKRIITIFGCGGDRDRLKRPKMGQVASLYSDYIILTSDNPRTESPNAIISNILDGVKTKNYQVIVDRKSAIDYAYSISGPSDIILIAGKGAEDYIEINGQRKIYSDYESILPYIK